MDHEGAGFGLRFFIGGKEASMQEVRREHPEYKSNRAMRQKYRDLYTGGERFTNNAAAYLVPRRKEPADVYSERLARVYYENYIGSIIDWYAATTFRREPIITTDGNESGRAFFSGFIEDCDRRGTAISDFFRARLTDALVDGVGYMLLDFPRPQQRPANRAEEDASGASRAYLTSYTAEDVTNWSRDEQDELEWVVIRKPGRWYRYDRERFRVYRGTEGSERLKLIDEGPHALAAAGRVPLFELKTSENLWLMNKAASLQLEHFNKSNALSWALTMGLFAMPVVYSDREFKQMVGESYYIQLGPEDKFGWTEPEGHVFQLAAENLTRLKDEMYRVCYVTTQAGGGLGQAIPQSGLSKQRDFTTTQEMLRAYGDAVKDSLKRVLRAVNEARQDGLEIGVSGLDEFDVGDFSGELEDAKRLLELGVESQTLKRHIFRKLAFKYLCDVGQGVKDQIAKEIDEAFAEGNGEK